MWLDGILKLLISLTGIPPRNSRSYPRIASHKASTSRPAIQACGRTRVAYPVRSPYVLLGRSDYGQCERACLIVGFDRGTNAPALYEYDDINGEPVEARPAHINGYLLDASDVFVEARSQKTGP